MNRQNFASSSKWEDIVGYSRAVRVSDLVEISGTVAVDEQGETVGLNDASTQTEFILNKISHYLNKAGATLDQVIRTKIYVTDISKLEEIGKTHGRFFQKIKPVTTMIEVSKLISDD